MAHRETAAEFWERLNREEAARKKQLMERMSHQGWPQSPFRESYTAPAPKPGPGVWGPPKPPAEAWKTKPNDPTKPPPGSWSKKAAPAPTSRPVGSNGVTYAVPKGAWDNTKPVGLVKPPAWAWSKRNP
jgi:hypothetical protein